jgi:hypothetical protein
MKAEVPGAETILPDYYNRGAMATGIGRVGHLCTLLKVLDLEFAKVI